MVELSHDSRPIIGRGPLLGVRFTLLAAASIALMVLDYRYDQLARVRGWLAVASYPLQVMVDAPVRAWHWLGESVTDRSTLRSENLELTARLRLANLQLQRFTALEDENLRLRDMRAATTGVADKVLVAEILNVDLDPFRHRVLLDKGAADGVFKGQAVLDADGIVGQIFRVNPRSAEAVMISDTEHAIPVQSVRSGVRTIAVGTGDLARLSLPFVTVETDLKVGDKLLSSGMGGVFPPDYPVAEITRVERAAKSTFAIVEAKPASHLGSVREALLVWFKPRPTEEPAPEAATAAAASDGAATAAGTTPASARPANAAAGQAAAPAFAPATAAPNSPPAPGTRP